jgi:hypothetical protein
MTAARRFTPSLERGFLVCILTKDPDYSHLGHKWRLAGEVETREHCMLRGLLHLHRALNVMDAAARSASGYTSRSNRRSVMVAERSVPGGSGPPQPRLEGRVSKKVFLPTGTFWLRFTGRSLTGLKVSSIRERGQSYTALL